MLEQLQRKWDQLAKREQLLISAVTILIVAFIVYFLCWLPLSTAVDIQATQAKQEIQNIVWLKKATAKLQAYQSHGLNIRNLIASSNNKQSNKNILATAKKSLRTSGLDKFISISKPIPQDSQDANSSSKNKNSIALQFREVPFASLTEWLQKLWLNEHIALTAISLKKSNANGTADVKLQLGY